MLVKYKLTAYFILNRTILVLIMIIILKTPLAVVVSGDRLA